MLHVACSVSPLQLLQPVRHLATQQLTVVAEKKRSEKKREEKKRLRVNLMRSQVVYRAARGWSLNVSTYKNVH